MGTYTQRKAFDAVELAQEQAMAFHDPAFKVPGIEIATRVAEEDGTVWLYLTQTGDLVGEDVIILPDWELVP
jgi:hypothetical protein